MRFFLDVQGTLIGDKDYKPLPGAIEFVRRLDTPFVLVTNNTKRLDFKSYLQSLGFVFENYLDPLMVLDEVVPKEKLAAFGSEGFLKALEAKGFCFDYQKPQSVVISVKSSYTFDEFAKINEFLLQGAKLFGMHKTSLYVHNNRRYPGVGALLEMFSFATGAEYKVVGKPSPLFFQKALEMIGGGSFEDVVMVSDDAKGDLEGAKALGMKTALVLTGKIRSEDETAFKPDWLFSSLDEAAKVLGVDDGSKTK